MGNDRWLLETSLAAFLIVLAIVHQEACGGQQASAVVCAPDETMCSGSCAALYKDPANCGACGTSCAQGTVCSQGACATSCGGGTIQCGQSCVDTLVDRDNCSGCGVSCPSGNVCIGGQCTSTCATGEALCTLDGGVAYCARTASDNDNCGSCGNVCDPSLRCTSGVCAPACDSEQTSCVPDAGLPFCTDTSNDPDNCGFCFKSCGTDGYCGGGGCGCYFGKTWCDGCTDTQTDDANCGGCGKTCSGTCAGGRCVQTIATTTDQVYDLASDSNGVFVATTYAVLAVPNGGGSSVDITSAYTLNGAIHSVRRGTTKVYFADWRYNDTRICSVLPGGGTVDVLAEISDDAWDIAVDGTNVYARGASAVYSVPIGGGSVTTMASSDGYLYADAIVSDGSANVYWTKGADIVGEPIGGGSVTTYHTGGVGGQLATRSGYIYFATQAGIARTTPTSPIWYLEGVTVLGGAFTPGVSSYDIYVGDSTSIWRVDATTLGVTKIVDDSNDLNVGITVSSSYVFWVDAAGNVRQTTN